MVALRSNNTAPGALLLRASQGGGAPAPGPAPGDNPTPSALKLDAAGLVRAMRAGTVALKLTEQSLQAVVDAIKADYEGLGTCFGATMALVEDDTTFWGYDAFWLQSGTPRLTNLSTASSGGGGGRNVSFNNNQYWSLPHECSKELFSNVLFQPLRFAAAQVRLKRLLRRAPYPDLLRAIDRVIGDPARPIWHAINDGDVAREIRPNTPERTAEWSSWCSDVLATIGVARWASGFTWSNLFLAPRTISEWPINLEEFGGMIAGPDDNGNRYLPDLGDGFGCPFVGYVSPTSDYHAKVVKAFVDRTSFVESRVQSIIGRSDVWENGVVREHFVIGLPAGNIRLPRPDRAMNGLSIAPKVLGLKRTDESHLAFDPVVPTSKDAFAAFYDPQALFMPRCLQLSGLNHNAAIPAHDYFQWIAHLSLSRISALSDQQREIVRRERKHDAQQFKQLLDLMADSGLYWGVWNWRGGFADLTEFWTPFVTAGPDLHILMLAAMAQDIVETNHAELVVRAFNDLEEAIAKFPRQFLGTASDSLDALRAQAKATVELISGMIASVGGAIAQVVSAINPYAGAIVAVIVTLTAVLVGFSLEIGIHRAKNPPVLPSIALRTVPKTGTEDRCDINIGGRERVQDYFDRVARPFAEAARRSGGNLDRMFDLIPEVRAELFGGSGLEAPPARRQNSSMLPFLALGGAGLLAAMLAAKK